MNRKQKFRLTFFVTVLSMMCSLYAEEIASTTADTPDELRALLAEANEHHPQLKARYEDWLAALQRVPQVTALDDPIFRYKYFINSNSDSYWLMLQQKVPWFGTLRVRGEQAAAEAEAKRIRLQDERNKIAAAVKEAWFEYGYLLEQVKITEERMSLLAGVEEIAQSRYATGVGTQDEVAQAQIERAQLDDLHAQLIQMLAPAASDLNAAVGRPQSQEVPTPKAQAMPPDPPSAEELTRLLQGHNPLLAAYAPELEARSKAIELAQMQKYPDFSLETEYEVGRHAKRVSEDPLSPGKLSSYRDLLRTMTGAQALDPVGAALDAYDTFLYKMPGKGKDEFSIAVSMNIPLHRKKLRAGVDEARHLYSATEWERKNEANDLEKVSRNVLFEINDARRRFHFNDQTLLPQAEASVESLQAAYASNANGNSFGDVLKGMQMVLNIQLDRARALRDWRQAAARLEMLLGTTW